MDDDVVTKKDLVTFGKILKKEIKLEVGMLLRKNMLDQKEAMKAFGFIDEIDVLKKWEEFKKKSLQR